MHQACRVPGAMPTLAWACNKGPQPIEPRMPTQAWAWHPAAAEAPCLACHSDRPGEAIPVPMKSRNLAGLPSSSPTSR
ncbi:hypothetical protein Pla175_37760 [Pirellulimonas nuda]|uniref:Uncharacterized protein n=1 Tax=Pirellulimonas nuda TaxID=2528009 RepID=A0A518DG13_9BACT|nr:hypothetical protein Pla175_37760 [Pirellulimonas nuda]